MGGSGPSSAEDAAAEGTFVPPPPGAEAPGAVRSFFGAHETTPRSATKDPPKSHERSIRASLPAIERRARRIVGYPPRVVPRVVRIDRDRPEPAVVAEAAAVLARGGLVAFPTETVYGLGARGLHPEDVARIFEAKRRPTGHPLILHVDGEAMARSLASTWSAQASRLARAFWPGPLTLVVPRASVVPREVTGGLDAVGLRSPRHPVALALIREVGEPLAAPSANAHMHVSPTTAEHVVRSLGDRVDLVLDAGPSAHGIESTVVDLTSDVPRVLRPGALALDTLRSVVPDVVYESVTALDGAARASPGLAAKHYAPHAPVVLADAGGLHEKVAEALARERRVHAIVFRAETAASLADEAARASDAASNAAATNAAASRVVVRCLPQDPEGYAHALFAAFYDADEASADVVVVEAVPGDASWWAVADRLRRAASKNG